MKRTSFFLPLILLISIVSLQAQIRSFSTQPDFVGRWETPSLTISREAVPDKPVSVIGPRGALLGQQKGEFEAWIFPWKILSGMRITANLQDYPAPIDVNAHAAWIDVHPDHTTITYSHASFTVRQIMLAPKRTSDGSGVLVFYTIEAVKPMTLTFAFEPAMQRMWPADTGDHPSAEWFVTEGGSGFYILRNSSPDRYAALAIPRAEAGVLPPYQERDANRPLQFVLRFDPKKDQNRLFPLLITFKDHLQGVTKEDAAANLESLDRSAEGIYRSNQSYYDTFISEHTSIETPDQSLNLAFSWAEVAMDQLRAQTQPDGQEPFTAGFAASGDGARPGFGWFFGRDGLWSLYAVNSYGDFEASRQEIEFLISHQRADGKIMHERSQTADLVDWKSLPYEFASADATPLLLMAVNDYLKISGDTAFVRAHWDALAKAWQFETSHDSADGIYNNDEGSGWVESWVPSMPHQEIYLAGLDEQASNAFADLAKATGHNDLAERARKRSAQIAQTIEQEYFLASSGFYAFSRNSDGSTDDTPTIFPSVAWWDGTFRLKHTDKMLPRWASNEFSTDWGTRILSNQVSFYDPISYHQGTVWPLFTGWVSVAEYRAGYPISGYAHLMQNVNLTWAQDLGSVIELLSGEFYQAPGRSTAHQLWSSAMVISPILRGMFGLDWNAAADTLSVTPHLPADWMSATIHRVPLGTHHIDLRFQRKGQEMIVQSSRSQDDRSTANIHLQSQTPGTNVEGDRLRIPLPPVEVAIREELPAFGEKTRQLKVLDEQITSHGLKLTLAAPALSRQTLLLRENAANLKAQTQDAEIGSSQNGLRTLAVIFPAGDGYVTKTVSISW